MGRPISGEYRIARRLLTGALDPTGLQLPFELDGSRVFTVVDTRQLQTGTSRVVAAGPLASISDDLAHATVAALCKRIGVTREARLRFLKPLYVKDSLRADGTMLRENNGLFTVSCRILDADERLCLEGEVEIFALQSEQVRRMTPDGMLPLELRRFFPV
ncbi:MAG: hotdog fold domain-containing protein [Myxococcota bacterium]